jgi:predicted transcriptional regulator
MYGPSPVRHKVLKEGQSIRRVARELGLSRNTVTKYLDQPEPVGPSRRQRERPVWEAVKPRLEELVAEWEPRTTAKQRVRLSKRDPPRRDTPERDMCTA